MSTFSANEAVTQIFNLKSLLTANSQIKFNMARSSRGNCKTANKSTPSKIETTCRTMTETTPSSNNNTSLNQVSNSSEEILFGKQHKDIDYLLTKVKYLEGKISELETCLFVTQWVNSLRKAKIDCQEQYSRRPCLVISGMNEPGDDKNDLDKVAETLAISAKTSLSKVSTASKKKYSKNIHKKTKQKIIEDQKKKKQPISVKKQKLRYYTILLTYTARLTAALLLCVLGS